MTVCANITDVVEKEIDLLKRHIMVLKAVKDSGPVGIIKLSQITGEPQHMMRYSLRTLEEAGLIRPSSRGAILEEGCDEIFNNAKSKIDKLISELQRIQGEL